MCDLTRGKNSHSDCLTPSQVNCMLVRPDTVMVATYLSLSLAIAYPLSLLFWEVTEAFPALQGGLWTQM